MGKCRPPSQASKFVSNSCLWFPLLLSDCSLSPGHTPVRSPSCNEKGFRDFLMGLLSLAGRAMCLGRSLG